MGLRELERVRRTTGSDGGTGVDVGCGLGELLDLLPAERWREFGIEVAESAPAECREKGISVELPEEEGWCDLVL